MALRVAARFDVVSVDWQGRTPATLGPRPSTPTVGDERPKPKGPRKSATLQFTRMRAGAGNGIRTRDFDLARSHSTAELFPPERNRIVIARPRPSRRARLIRSRDLPLVGVAFVFRRRSQGLRRRSAKPLFSGSTPTPPQLIPRGRLQRTQIVAFAAYPRGSAGSSRRCGIIARPAEIRPGRHRQDSVPATTLPVGSAPFGSARAMTRAMPMAPSQSSASAS